MKLIILNSRFKKQISFNTALKTSSAFRNQMKFDFFTTSVKLELLKASEGYK